MSNPRPGGEQWNQQNEQFRQILEDASRAHGVPIQILLNLGRLESDWRPGHVNASSGAQGLFQIMPDTRRAMEQAWGIRIDPFNAQQNADAAARYLHEIAYGTGLGAVTGYGQRREPDWELAVGGYNGGPTGYMNLLTGRPNPEGRWNANYVVQGLQGVRSWDELTPVARNSFDNFWGASSRPNVGGGIGSDANIPVFQGIEPPGVTDQFSRGPGAMLGQDPLWNQPGIINPEYGHYLQTLGLMPANLVPSGGTDFTNTTWTAAPGAQPGWWGPWGSEAIHNWAQEGVSHGYGDPIMSMLGNLNYNLVDPGLPPGSPPLGGTPSTTIGPTTGLPNVATGGVDLAHWIANQWGSSWGQRGADRPNIYDASNIPQTNPDMFTPGSNVYNAGNMFPADMRLPWDPASPRAETWAGHEDLRFWTPGQPSGETPGPSPIHVWGGDVTNWVPAPADSTWGTAGAVSPWAGYQAGQQNLWYSPITDAWGTPGGDFGPNTPGVENWHPSTGYSGGTGNPNLPAAGTRYPGWANPVPTTIAGNNESFGNVPVFSHFPTPPGGYGSPYPAPMPAPTPWYFNSGIGPGGIEIAPGYNTTPIYGTTIGPGGIPIAPGASNPYN